MKFRRRVKFPRPIKGPVTSIKEAKHLTDDRDDPRLHQASVDSPGMNDAYLVLSDEERSKGYVRPVRRSYVHVGPPGPSYPIRPLTEDEKARYAEFEYVAFEEYPKETGLIGRHWTQDQLDYAKQGGCGAVTTMSLPLAETYARSPGFYGSTYCVNCGTHIRVGKYGEFVWDGTDERVST
jgi:hypothetical protein